MKIYLTSPFLCVGYERSKKGEFIYEIYYREKLYGFEGRGESEV